MILIPPPWTPFIPAGPLGAAGGVLTSNGPGAAPSFKPASSAGGGVLSGRFASNLAAGTTNNLTFTGWPGASGARILLNPSAGASTLTGLVAGVDGQMVFALNVQPIGGNSITFANLSALSTAANQFTIAGATFILAPQQRSLLVYDATLALWSIG